MQTECTDYMYECEWTEDFLKRTAVNYHSDYVPEIKEAVDNSKVKKVVMNSLSDSLKNGINPYEKMEINPRLFDSKVERIKEQDDNLKTKYLDLIHALIKKKLVKEN